MHDRGEIIHSTLSSLEAITSVGAIAPIEDKKFILETSITLVYHGREFSFKVQIYHQYPFKLRDHETIRFINQDYVQYDHVNSDGSVCIHTDHNPDLKQKLEIDVKGLLDWIDKYAITQSEDQHYEHILVPNKPLDEIERSFLFTDVEYSFNKGDFGIFSYTPLLNGEFRETTTQTLVVQQFYSHNAKCDWNSYYGRGNEYAGFYYYNEEPPISTDNHRIAAANWKELEGYFSQGFLNALWQEQRSNKRLKKNTITPLLIGYPISEEKSHWVATVFKRSDLPNYSVKDSISGSYIGRMRDLTINWASSYDCTYDIFFGRGRLSDKLVSGNVLILGIGAIGSMLAKSLTRGGIREISLFDYDIKEPGNVCRSEYHFESGVTSKTQELAKQLLSISPFVNPSFSEELSDLLKSARGIDLLEKSARDFLNEYDLIFDCTTDNDMLYFLDSLKLDAHVISMSITNGAKELVCCQGKGLYNRTQAMFNTLETEDIDMFNPTGCWSPTFKASYNDIAVLVESAIKHLNGVLEKEGENRDFILQSSWDNGFKLSLKQF